MVKVSAGDDPSFGVLLERNRQTVVRHLNRVVRNRAIAEELAQDVFLRVYRSRETYNPGAKFATWLFRITRNVALNWRRDTRRERGDRPLSEIQARALDPVDGAPRADQRLLENQRAREIRGAVESLPRKQLAAVLLHKYYGMNYASIAAVLGCSTPALKSMLFRAYQTLRRKLAHLAPPEAEREMGAQRPDDPLTRINTGQGRFA